MVKESGGINARQAHVLYNRYNARNLNNRNQQQSQSSPELSGWKWFKSLFGYKVSFVRPLPILLLERIRYYPLFW